MREKRKQSIIISIAGVMFFAIMILCEIFFLTSTNKKTADMACSMMVGQIEEIISSNEENVSVLMDTLKDEYIVRAKTVAYIFEHDNVEKYSVEEYKKIAALVQVDEIHIFSTDGYIVDGTNPEYYGFSFDSGVQISFFRPMLSDVTLSMCQDLTPNTAEGKAMIYAMVWREDATSMVQIGITPDRLLEEMNNNDISEIVRSFPISDGTEVFIVNADNYTLEGCTSDHLIGMDVSDILGEDEKILPGEKYQRTVNIGKRRSYMTFEKFDNYIIAVSQTVSSANNNLLVSTIVVSIILLIAIVILWCVVRYAYKQILLREAMELHQQKLEFISYHDELTGAYNRHALYDRTDAFKEGSCQGIIFGDIMGLKRVNDSQGHEAGDELIKNVYHVMLEYFLAEDIFRIGGDEFVILVGAIPEEEMYRKKELLLKALENAGSPMALGCAWTDHYTGNYGELERKADSQMYEHKKAFYKEHPEYKR